MFLSSLRADLGFWKLYRLRNMSALVNHESSLELDDYRPFLSKSSCFHANYAHVGPRLGLPFLQHLAARIYGVSFKQRIGQAYLVPAKVGHDVLRDIHHRLPGYQGQREGRIHQWFPKLGLGGISVVKMNGIGILCEQREPYIIGRQNGASQGMLVDIADLEIFVNAPSPALLDCHLVFLLESSLNALCALPGCDGCSV